MPALDFKTLLLQERAKTKRQAQQQQQQQAKPPQEVDEHDDEDSEEEEEDALTQEEATANFAAHVDAVLGAAVAANVPAAEDPGNVDILALAAAKTVEHGQQAKHLFAARLDPTYLTSATLERDMAAHALPGPPQGVYYLPEFVSAQLEEEIIETAHSLPARHPKWVKLRGRRLQCYGGEPSEDVATFKPQRLPAWVQQLCQSLTLAGVFASEETPDHVLLNEYQPGQGIMAHTDGPFFRPRVAILSLGGPAIFRFRKRLATGEIDGTQQQSAAAAVGTVVLQPGSLIVFEGEAYHEHLHEILAVEEEVVGGEDGSAPVLNLATARGVQVGDTLRRSLRVSLTFRKVNRPEHQEEASS